MKTALIACSKNKMEFECEAQVMYSKSSLFKKTFNYCQNKYSRIYILSAKYGVLKPTDKICPYNLTLNSFSKTEIKNWASNCFRQLCNMGDLDLEFDFYAGKVYITELAKLLPKSTNILAGMGIGQRLKFLNQ